MPQNGDTAVAITLGDPTGIGPEVALGAAHALLRGSRPKAQAGAARAGRGGGSGVRVVLVGDLGAARAALERLALPIDLAPCAAAEVAHLVRAGARPGQRAGRSALAIASPDGVPALRAAERRPGRPNVAAARSAYAAIESAIGLAGSGAVSAICTAPISKEWFARAGVASTGHTEILAELTGSPGVRLMMALDDLRIVLATTHLALRDVAPALTVEGIAETVAVTARHLARWWRIARPRIAVAALNPHASDGGIYGDEEERVIAPAIARARAARIDAIGPVPADTLFSALGPRCDAVVAMYHDQGLIPVKQADVHRAVNVTLGLPFVRTSPDHGTAFDIAGRERADDRSMRAALDLAVALAGRAGRSGRMEKRGESRR